MAKWIEYTGSDEQIQMLAKSQTIVRVRYNTGIETNWNPIIFKRKKDTESLMIDARAYLICDPHPYADEIKIWADTGCEVYWKSKTGGGSGLCHENFPPFAHPGEFEYQLTPFED